jgi:predicted enzyme related to lactoylglutathione lyase
VGERTAHPPGTFSWVDLATPDVESAKAFYGGVFGWEAEDMPAGEDQAYAMCRRDGQWVAALYARPEPDERPPSWLSYVSVEDADAIAAAAREAGGTVVTEPFDVRDSGRMAVLEEPTGALVGVWQARSHIGAGLVNAPGALAWNELATREPERAIAFLEAVFGWTHAPFEGGATDYWAILNGGRSNGGIRRAGAEMGPEAGAHILPYFGAADVGAAAAKATELGGAVLLEPQTLPMGRFAVVADGQGAAFCLFSGDFDD